MEKTLLFRRGLRFAALCSLMFLSLSVAALASAGGRTEAAGLPATGALDAAAGRALIDRLGDKLAVLDVRTPKEFGAGHIPGAVNIPVEALEARMAEVPLRKPLLIVCRTGIRAARAYGMVHAAHPDKFDMWSLRTTPEYHSDGTFSFH